MSVKRYRHIIIATASRGGESQDCDYFARFGGKVVDLSVSGKVQVHIAKGRRQHDILAFGDATGIAMSERDSCLIIRARFVEFDGKNIIVVLAPNDAFWRPEELATVDQGIEWALHKIRGMRQWGFGHFFCMGCSDKDPGRAQYFGGKPQ